MLVHPRLYRHYKGGLYMVVGIGKHTETSERLVAYNDLDGEIHFRPHTMFFGYVEVDGEKVRRFAPVKKEVEDNGR